MTLQTGTIDLTPVVSDAAAVLRRRFADGETVPAATRSDDDPADVLASSLFELALAWPGDEPLRRKLVLGAVAHGALRRAQDQSEGVVFQDYEDLRTRSWVPVRDSGLPPAAAADVILSLDAAISLAIAASLRGFHRDVIARSGAWERVIDRLVWDWRIYREVQDDR